MDKQTDLKEHKRKVFARDGFSTARLNMGHMGKSWAAGVAETNVEKKVADVRAVRERIKRTATS